MDDTSVLAMDLEERDEGLPGACCSPSTLPVPIESIMSGGSSATSGQMDLVSLWATFAGHPWALEPSTYSLFVSGATKGLKNGGAADVARVLLMRKVRNFLSLVHIAGKFETSSDSTYTSQTFSSFDGTSDRMNWYGAAFPAGSGRL